MPRKYERLLESEIERLAADPRLHSAAARALSYPATVAPEQIRNLLSLARHLAALPEDYAQFEMNWYRSACSADLNATEEDREDLALGRLPCGTSACAAGHGPISTGKVRRHGEDWGQYIARVFGTIPTNYSWFLFSAWWTEVDNTPQGAAARIAHLVGLASQPLSNLPRTFRLPWDQDPPREEIIGQYKYLL